MDCDFFVSPKTDISYISTFFQNSSPHPFVCSLLSIHSTDLYGIVNISEFFLESSEVTVTTTLSNSFLYLLSKDRYDMDQIPRDYLINSLSADLALWSRISQQNFENFENSVLFLIDEILVGVDLLLGSTIDHDIFSIVTNVLCFVIRIVDLGFKNSDILEIFVNSRLELIAQLLILDRNPNIWNYFDFDTSRSVPVGIFPIVDELMLFWFHHLNSFEVICTEFVDLLQLFTTFVDVLGQHNCRLTVSSLKFLNFMLLKMTSFEVNDFVMSTTSRFLKYLLNLDVIPSFFASTFSTILQVFGPSIWESLDVMSTSNKSNVEIFSLFKMMLALTPNSGKFNSNILIFFKDVFRIVSCDNPCRFVINIVETCIITDNCSSFSTLISITHATISNLSDIVILDNIKFNAADSSSFYLIMFDNIPFTPKSVSFSQFCYQIVHCLLETSSFENFPQFKNLTHPYLAYLYSSFILSASNLIMSSMRDYKFQKSFLIFFKRFLSMSTFLQQFSISLPFCVNLPRRLVAGLALANDKDNQSFLIDCISPPVYVSG
ncbi:hypothetical protein GEMRC1_011408 [Eukaryota sp. GEM-RC1]